MKAQLHQLTVLLKFVDPHFYSYLGNFLMLNNLSRRQPFTNFWNFKAEPREAIRELRFEDENEYEYEI